MKYLLQIVIISLCLGFGGCKKLLEVDSPVTKYDAEKVYDSDASAIAVMTAIYQEMSGDGMFQGTNGFSFLIGLTADELTDYSGGTTIQYIAYQNQLTSTNVPFWSRLYTHVYRTNTAIQGISESKLLTPVIQSRLLGEAKFMRGFLYFYLVNLWGDVPLVLTNDYIKNSSVSRSSPNAVYQQIISDLNEAETLLTSEYLLSDLVSTTDERIRPNKWAAKALLARAFLYAKKYQEAELKATEVIDNVSLFQLTTLNESFLSNSREAIWQIQAINPSWNTYEARGFILSSAPNSSQSSSLSEDLVNAFESGDLRYSNWIGSLTENGITYYYPNKYKANVENEPHTEALTVLRLAEQFLIRAEAKAEQNNSTGAIQDLNEIRKRSRAIPTMDVPAPLPEIPNNMSKESLLTAIQHERQVELFTEWGHRWFDLKRTGRIDAVMSVVTPKKGGVWSSFRELFPIPQSDLQYNINMTQNSGY